MYIVKYIYFDTNEEQKTLVVFKGFSILCQMKRLKKVGQVCVV